MGKEIDAVGVNALVLRRNVFNKTGDYEGVVDRCVKPSRGLLKKIDKLPVGSKVGIEYYPYSETVMQEEVQKLMHFSSFSEERLIDFFEEQWNYRGRNHYWDKIIGECKKRDLEVVFLENCDDNKRCCEYLGKSHILNNLSFIRDCFPEFFKDGYDNSDDLLMRNMSYSNYQRYIGTPNNVIRNIIKEQPDLVILSKETLDHWVRSGKPGTALTLPNDPKIKEIEMEIMVKDESDSIRSSLVDYTYGKSGKAGEEKRKEVADSYVRWIVSNEIQPRNV